MNTSPKIASSKNVAARSRWSLGGLSTVTVGDLMMPAVVVRRSTPLREVARRILDHHVEAVAVVDDAGKLRGLITERDFRLRERCFSLERVPSLFDHWVSLARGVEAVYAEAADVPARDVMWSRLATATEDEPVSDAVERMMHQGEESAVVLRDEVPVGLFGRRDLLRLVARPAAPAPTSEPVAARKEPAQHGSWRRWRGWRRWRRWRGWLWLCLPFFG